MKNGRHGQSPVLLLRCSSCVWRISKTADEQPLRYSPSNNEQMRPWILCTICAPEFPPLRCLFGRIKCPARIKRSAVPP
jgi:hypothetical protein